MNAFTHHRRAALLAGPVLLAAVTAAAQPPADAEALPEYTLEPCCELCPSAYDPAAYNTSYLRSFRMLRQGGDGWLFRSKDDLGVTFGPDEHGVRDLARLRVALERHGVTLVMVIQPPRGLMHRNRLQSADRSSYNHELAQFSYVRTLQRLREAGIVVPDLERLVYEAGKAQDDYYFRADHHWTPAGARRTAEIVAESVQALPVLDGVARQSFVTRPAGLFRKRGTFNKAVQRLCGFGAPAQYVPVFSTEPAEETDGAGLLGEAPAPAITLVGTSNSDPAYNFAGFLSEFLEADVLNAAAAGGGMDGALMSYLSSSSFREQPPRILIWELAPYHDLSDDAFYRQAIPLVDDGCARQPALLTRRHRLRSGRNEVLFNGGGRVLDLRADTVRIDLRFSTGGVGEAETTVWYTDGSRDTMNLRTADDGRVAFDLRSDEDRGGRTFLSLDLQPTTGLIEGSEVEARLCARPSSSAAAFTAYRSQP